MTASIGNCRERARMRWKGRFSAHFLPRGALQKERADER
jgi:hypothetical protein